MQLYRIAVAVCLGVFLLMASAPAEAQYQLINLVSNQVRLGPFTDPLLANAWGLARSATSPWWVSDTTPAGRPFMAQMELKSQSGF